MFDARALALAAIVAVGAALLPTLAHAQGGYHYIVGLNPRGDNFLALRSEPSTRYGYRLARLGPQTLLAPTGERAGIWLAVDVANGPNVGMTGWVHGRYVACCTGAPRAAAPPPSVAGWGRAEPPGAHLNMRSGPSLSARIVGAIPFGGEAEVYECVYESAIRSWCQVNYAGRVGWVSTRYFARY